MRHSCAAVALLYATLLLSCDRRDGTGSTAGTPPAPATGGQPAKPRPVNPYVAYETRTKPLARALTLVAEHFDVQSAPGFKPDDPAEIRAWRAELDERLQAVEVEFARWQPLLTADENGYRSAELLTEAAEECRSALAALAAAANERAGDDIRRAATAAAEGMKMLKSREGAPPGPLGLP